MGFWNNVLGMIGFAKFKQKAIDNYTERQEYESLVKQKTLEKRLLKQQQELEQLNSSIAAVVVVVVVPSHHHHRHRCNMSHHHHRYRCNYSVPMDHWIFTKWNKYGIRGSKIRFIALLLIIVTIMITDKNQRKKHSIAMYEDRKKWKKALCGTHNTLCKYAHVTSCLYPWYNEK